MNSPIITYRNFETPKAYLSLQNSFAVQDIRESPEENNYSKPVVADFTIVVKQINDVTEEENYMELSFQKDFLFPKIDSMSKRFIYFFKKELDDKLILEEKQVEIFAKRYFSKFALLKENIVNSDYLHFLVKSKLEQQLDITMDYLSSVHINPNYLVSDKMKFNLNKTDLLLLFTLLREQEYVDHKYDNELGALIDKYFVFFDGQEYKSISNSRRVINDLKNGNRGINKSYQRLHDMFTKLLASVAPI